MPFSRYSDFVERVVSGHFAIFLRFGPRFGPRLQSSFAALVFGLLGNDAASMAVVIRVHVFVVVGVAALSAVALFVFEVAEVEESAEDSEADYDADHDAYRLVRNV